MNMHHLNKYTPIPLLCICLLLFLTACQSTTTTTGTAAASRTADHREGTEPRSGAGFSWEARQDRESRSEANLGLQGSQSHVRKREGFGRSVIGRRLSGSEAKACKSISFTQRHSTSVPCLVLQLPGHK